MINRDYVDFEDINVMWMPMLLEDGTIKTERYNVNNMIAGDTDSSYIAIPDKLTDGKSHDDIVDMVDGWCQQANSEFSSYVSAVFNCPEERLGSIAADREAVSDKSLFLTKKRYIMHIINMEGEKCDTLKIMGVEIKKSDTPPIVKEILMDLVNRILDGCTRDELKAAIADHKEKFFRAPASEIAKPSGCKTLRSAQRQLEETGDLHGVHYSARAAMFYNSMCTSHDQPVRPGDKIGLIYIDHPNSKYIGYPLDSEHLPDWFDSIIIDYNTNWKKAHKKIVNYMASLGWDVETVNKKIREDLFGF